MSSSWYCFALWHLCLYTDLSSQIGRCVVATDLEVDKGHRK